MIKFIIGENASGKTLYLDTCIEKELMSNEGNGMQATLVHDIATNTVQFNAHGISLIYAIPSRIENIEKITDYDGGFLTMQTNYGEEYTDLLEIVHNSRFSEKFKSKAKNIFQSISLSDIVLKRS